MRHEPNHPPLSVVSTGVRGRCPRCGEGRLFEGYLATARGCTVCGLDYTFFDSGDGPAVFVMSAVGLIVVVLALFTELAHAPPYWVHAALWLPLAVILSLGLLRPAKGMLLSQQYRTSAEEGRHSHE